MELRFAVNNAVDESAFGCMPVAIVTGDKRRAAIVIGGCNLVTNLRKVSIRALDASPEPSA